MRISDLKRLKLVRSIGLDHDYVSWIPSSDLSFSQQREANDIFLERIQIFNNPVILYTDGSKLDSGDAGYAVFCANPDFYVQRKISPLNSIFEAEAMAIIDAILSIDKYDLNNVLIASDSLSVLSGLSAPDIKGKLHTAVPD